MNEGYYKGQAEQYGDSKNMSMKDSNIKEMEIEEIIKYLKSLIGYYPKARILEIGCGNGYTAMQISEELGLDLICIDSSIELIEIARERCIPNLTFIEDNILNLNFPDGYFDIVFCERCLINLESWDDQIKALNELYRVLKPKGAFIMIEAFKDGLSKINAARDSLGLDLINEPEHNLYFYRQKLLAHIEYMFQHFYINHPDFSLEYNEDFLSSYYFGSKVIYPALMKKDKIEYNNAFVDFFKYLPSYADYAYVKSFVFEKK